MITISKITTQKKNDERFNIFIDRGHGEEYGFSVDQDVLISYELKKGKQLPNELMEKIFFDDDIKKAFNMALQYLSYRMRSNKEIVDHLKKKEIDENVITKVIEKLANYKYTDDLEFGKALVRTRFRTSSKGPIMIKKELIEKGLNEKEIDESMSEYSIEEQVDKAYELLSKQTTKFSKLSAIQRVQKLKQLLSRKGFTHEVIDQAMSIWNEDTTEEENDDEYEALKYQAEKFQRKYSKFDGWEYAQKMKQALYRKGFKIEHIDRFLQEEKELGEE